MTSADGQFLQAYAERGSEEAFRRLVERYTGLVFSVALRCAGGEYALAEDVTQTVFADLARKASSLPRKVVLGGWLHQHTCYVASHLIRAEVRRRLREQTGAEMNELDRDTADTWRWLAPVLDDALNRLPAVDRDAVVLRFFENHDLKTVGAALGVSEDTAQKRVSRALEKLRAVLLRRGAALSLSATGLGALLASQAVGAAPTSLAANAASAALASASTVAGGGVISTLFYAMTTSTKLKIGAAAIAAIAIVVTPVVLQQKAISRLSLENARLTQAQEDIVQLRQENQRLARLKDLPPPPSLELMRLRGEVGLLRSQLRQQTAQRLTNTPPASSSASAPGTVEPLRGEVTARVGSGQTLVTGGWTTEPGKHAFLFVTPVVDPKPDQPGRIIFRSEILEMTDDALDQSGLKDYTTEARESSLAGLYTMDQGNAFRKAMQGLEGAKSESQVQIAFEGGTTKFRLGSPFSTNAPSQRAGPLVELFPRITPGGDSVDLTIRSELPSP